MLDQKKLFEALENKKEFLFSNYMQEISLACETWNQIADEVTFDEINEAKNNDEMIPYWQERLSNKKQLIDDIDAYQVLAIDGSQIYPDRHEGMNFAVLNVGGVFFDYADKSTVDFFSEPYVYDVQFRENHEISVDNIDAYRQELEYHKALKMARHYCDKKPIVLFDGSLIFWQLMDKPRLKKHYFERYSLLLQELYKSKILFASYVSLPKSRELVNIIHVALNKQGVEHSLKRVVDADIMNQFLAPYQRSILFKNQATIVEDYPDAIRPYFFYCNVGEEIARIEIPQWIAQDIQLLELIEKIVINQCKKGGGYPVSLAEAHEVAVVRQSDRQLFLYMLRSLYPLFSSTISKKLLSKKNVRA